MLSGPVEAANKASKLSPKPEQFRAQLEQYQEEELLRVFASMKRVGGQPAVDYLLGFAENKANSDKKRANALAALQGNLESDAGELDMPAKLRLASVAQETPALPDAAIDYVLGGDEELATAMNDEAEAGERGDMEAMARAHHRIEELNGYDGRARVRELGALRAELRDDDEAVRVDLDVPRRLVPPVIVASGDQEPLLVPDDLRSMLEPDSLKRGEHLCAMKTGMPDVGDVSRKQGPRLAPVGAVVIRYGPGRPGRLASASFLIDDVVPPGGIIVHPKRRVCRHQMRRGSVQ